MAGQSKHKIIIIIIIITVIVIIKYQKPPSTGPLPLLFAPNREHYLGPWSFHRKLIFH